MELIETITKYKEKMAQFSPDSPAYTHYQSLIADLEAKLPKPTVTLHKAEEALCESCQ